VGVRAFDGRARALLNVAAALFQEPFRRRVRLEQYLDGLVAAISAGGELVREAQRPGRTRVWIPLEQIRWSIAVSPWGRLIRTGGTPMLPVRRAHLTRPTIR